MSGFEKPLRFQFSSSSFNSLDIEREILSLKFCSTAFSNALKNIPNIVDGIPLNQIIVTDDKNKFPLQTFGLASERAVLSPDGTLYIGLNPALTAEFNGQVISIGETVLHGLGHFSPAANAARARGDDNGVEDAAVAVQNTLRQEAGLPNYVRNGGTLSSKPWSYFYKNGGQCFPADIPILMADGSEKPIDAIRAGDLVVAIDNGHFVPGEVGRVYRNVTPEWLVLRAADGARDRFGELTVTPGHHFRRAASSFARIDDILREDGIILLADGAPVEVVAERVVYSAETAHLYEQAGA